MNSKKIVRKLVASIDIEINGSRPWDIQVYNDMFYRRVLGGGSMALGESYMDGWWNCRAIDELAEKFFRAGMNKKVRNPQSVFAGFLMAKFFNLQNRLASKKSVCHYDIDNNLYQHMLGRTMAYTCGYWKDAEMFLSHVDLLSFDLCRKFQIQAM